MHRTARLALLGLFLSLPPLADAAPRPVVLFDQGHGQRFLVEETGELHLSALAEVFRAEGFEVRSAAARLDRASLEGVRALVTSGLFVPYDGPELAEIAGFMERGGGLAAMLHIAPTYAGLLERLGVIASSGVLNETEDLRGGNPLDFRVTSFLPHPLTAGLKSFSVYGGWAVMHRAQNASTLAFTGRGAWLDANRSRTRDPDEPLHAYGVLVAGTLGRGRFAVFGDDAIFQNRFLDPDNRALAANLARWLRAAP